MILVFISSVILSQYIERKRWAELAVPMGKIGAIFCACKMWNCGTTDWPETFKELEEQNP